MYSNETPSCYLKINIYYIQINEIQENIDEITCMFQKVLFSVMKNVNSVEEGRKHFIILVIGQWGSRASSINLTIVSSVICNRS